MFSQAYQSVTKNVKMSTNQLSPVYLKYETTYSNRAETIHTVFPQSSLMVLLFVYWMNARHSPMWFAHVIRTVCLSHLVYAFSSHWIKCIFFICGVPEMVLHNLICSIVFASSHLKKTTKKIWKSVLFVNHQISLGHHCDHEKCWLLDTCSKCV